MPQKLPDISKLNRESLLALQGEIQAQLKARAEQEKAEAIKALADLAEAKGFSLDELVGGKGAKKGKKPVTKGVAKYRNPANPSQTWTGKGRQPKWFAEAVAAGTSPDAMAI